jgi:Glycosyl transferase family 11
VISVEARGRLGNHMFQFAFGLGASARLGTDFAMDDRLLRTSFTLAPWGTQRRRIARGLRYRGEKRLWPFEVVKVEPEAFEEPSAVMVRLRDRRHYVGFFQSEQFFQAAAANVQRAFRARPELEHAFREKYASLLQCPYICCHVRQTDYREWGGGLALPASYYAACLRALRERSNAPIVVVGDDPEWLKDELAYENIRVEHNPAVIDLLLLVHAQSLVISNSSFAWWGAWLNESASRILAPRYWIGFKMGREAPHRILPPSWEQMPVDSTLV